MPAFFQQRLSDTVYLQGRCHCSSVESSPNMANRHHYPGTGWQHNLPIHNYNPDEEYDQSESSRGFQGKFIGPLLPTQIAQDNVGILGPAETKNIQYHGNALTQQAYMRG
jgi:hypothetical protein